MTYAHSYLNQKQLPEAQEIPPRQTAAKITSTQPALLTVTHPSIPSQEGKHHTQTTYYQQETSTRTSPLERGWGCVTPGHSLLKSKTSTQNPRNTTSPNSSKNHLNPARAPHRDTPLHPLSRGEISHHKPLITKNIAPSKISPLERGGGCVTVRGEA